MDISKALNVVGLLLDIAGAGIMFFNTPHPKAGTWIGTSEELKNDMIKERKEKARVKWGMGLLIGGFLFQIIATFFS